MAVWPAALPSMVGWRTIELRNIHMCSALYLRTRRCRPSIPTNSLEYAPSRAEACDSCETMSWSKLGCGGEMFARDYWHFHRVRYAKYVGRLLQSHTRVRAPPSIPPFVRQLSSSLLVSVLQFFLVQLFLPASILRHSGVLLQALRVPDLRSRCAEHPQHPV